MDLCVVDLFSCSRTVLSCFPSCTLSNAGANSSHNCDVQKRFCGADQEYELCFSSLLSVRLVKLSLFFFSLLVLCTQCAPGLCQAEVELTSWFGICFIQFLEPLALLIRAQKVQKMQKSQTQGQLQIQPQSQSQPQ